MGSIIVVVTEYRRALVISALSYKTMTIPVQPTKHLNIPTVVVRHENEVPLWTVEDVAAWVSRVGFQSFSLVFSDLGVDGDMLLQLTEAEIRDDVGLNNGILRKRFMRELKELKKNADYTSCDGGLMANFLSKISQDFKVYAYNMILKELSLDFMQRLSSVDLDDMLVDAGVDSAIHRHKIIEAVLSMDDEDTGLSDSGISEQGHDVYISSPDTGGAELASLIQIQLGMRCGDMSIMAECHHADTVSERSLATIRDARHYLLILLPGGLDTVICRRRGRLYRELVTAVSAGVKIIPVTLEFIWPSAESLPEEIRPLSSFNGVRWIHDYQDACIDKLERFIRGESSRVSSPFNLRRDVSQSSSSPMMYHKAALKNRAVSHETVFSSQST